MVPVYALTKSSLLAHIPTNLTLLYSPEINEFPQTPSPHMLLVETEYVYNRGYIGLRALQSVHQGVIHDPVF